MLYNNYLYCYPRYTYLYQIIPNNNQNNTDNVVLENGNESNSENPLYSVRKRNIRHLKTSDELNSPKRIKLESTPEIQDQIFINEDMAVSLSENCKIEINSSLARYYEKTNDYATALENWMTLSEKRISQTSNEMGKIYLQLNKYEKALSCFQKAITNGDKEADFNLALTFDAMRNAAKDVDEREKFRKLAIMNYNRISADLPMDHPDYLSARFNSTFLSHLNEKGEFSPHDINAAKKEYKKLKTLNANDSRPPLLMALLEFKKYQNSSYELTKKTRSNNTPQLTVRLVRFERYLKASKEKGNEIAAKLLKCQSTALKKKLRVQFDGPQKIYLSFDPRAKSS